MPRPTKCRRVCRFPKNAEFMPASGGETQTPVILTVDEYETIRLIDKEGLSQEACSAYMQIARTTVQKIYETARKKLADVIVDGLPLKIEGGEFKLCEGENHVCGSDGCYRQDFREQYQIPKGEHYMRIAVTYENGMIFQHFGHTEQFKIYDIADGKVVSSEVVSTNGSGHGALAEVLNTLKADVLICGGIGGGAQMALASIGVKLYGGVSGEADAAVDALLAGKLDYNPNVKCSHHDHEHGGEAHTCGSHGCGHGHCRNH